jgi:hypothetical protein
MGDLMCARSKKRLLAMLLVGLSCGLAGYLIWNQPLRSPMTDAANRPIAAAPSRASEKNWLEAKEQKMNETVWAKEMLAQQCGLTFDSLWDTLNNTTNKLPVIAAFPLGELILGTG